MIIRGLDANGEWLFGRGQQDYARGKEAIILNIKTRLRSFVNDCFFDQEAGIDWLNRLGNNNQREFLEADVQNQILNSFGVTNIVDFDSSLDGRKLTLNYTISTIDGDVSDVFTFKDAPVLEGFIQAGNAFTTQWQATIMSGNAFTDDHDNYIFSR